MIENMPKAITDKQFTSANIAEVNCWGIFKTLQHKSPMVYCQTEAVALAIQNDKTYHHYSAHYADCVLKKITMKVKI